MTLKLGIVDCDTSHVVAFTQRLHHVDIGEDHWVNGAQIVAAVPLPTLVTPERVGPFVEKLRAYYAATYSVEEPETAGLSPKERVTEGNRGVPSVR